MTENNEIRELYGIAKRVHARLRVLEQTEYDETGNVPDPVAQGDILVADAVPVWDVLAVGGAHALLKTNASGTLPAWAVFDWDNLAAGSGADMVHSHQSNGEGAQLDHGAALTGLGDDDHSQYYNATRHTAAIHNSLSLDHGALSGKSDDDHSQYYNATRHTAAIHNSLSLDHGALSGKSDDDHAQYLLVSGARTGATSNVQVFTNRVDANGGVHVLGSTRKRVSGSALYLYDNVGSFDGSSGPYTGTLVLRVPAGKSDDRTMMHVRVVGYEYNADRGPWQLILGGYNYTSGWINVGATVIGPAPFESVRYGHDASGNDVIMIGTTGTVWSYPQVFIEALGAGYVATSDWDSAWTTSIISSETGYVVEATANLFLYVNMARDVVVRNNLIVNAAIKLYYGATWVGEISTNDADWLRINQNTGKNTYTPGYFRADGGVVAGNTVPASGELRSTSHARVGGGLYVGSLGTVPDVDDLHLDGSINKSIALGCSAYCTTATSLTTSVWTTITWTTQVNDTDGCFTPSSAYLYAKKAGYYSIAATCSLQYAASVSLAILKNGGIWIAQSCGEKTGGYGRCCVSATMVYMAYNDYFYIQAMQSTGATRLLFPATSTNWSLQGVSMNRIA